MSMRDQAAERRLKLALHVREKGPVTRADIQRSLREYAPSGAAKPESMRRMFERDKAALAEAGLCIEATEDGRYVLDRAASMCEPVQLSDSEADLLRTVCTALICDPSYAFKDDLRAVAAKLGAELEAPDSLATQVAGPAPRVGIPAKHKGGAPATMRKVRSALAEHRPLAFAYPCGQGQLEWRRVEAVGVFQLEGHRYLAAKDLTTGKRRTFRLDRMRKVNGGGAPLPGRAEPFCREDWLLHSFQLGENPFAAQVRFNAEAAWQAAGVTAGKGTLETLGDGSVLWTVNACSAEALASWCIQHGPGIRPVYPEAAAAAYRDGLMHVMEECS